MPSPQTYQLLDFGEGRKLEQFGPVRLDRPCPGTEQVPRSDSALWQSADARFMGTSANAGQWELRRELPERWTIRHGPIAMELKRSESGHVGLFPEQTENWDWLTGQAQSASEPIRVLNLFAYTGGSTLVCAAAGAEVTHADAARNVVAWARRNAELSGLGTARIRWIAEDAGKFVRREARRGSAYDAVILDPPSYGHGPKGEVWRLSRQLPRLLALCAELTAGRCRFVLLTCHTPGYGPPRLEAMVRDAFGEPVEGRWSSGIMMLRTAAGRELPSGVAVRWASDPRRGRRG
jgi:23S rRNA (cytosine1962-C5)-methyltransferase